MHVFLVEPDMPVKYPNLALMRISSKHKSMGDTVEYIKGCKYPKNDILDIFKTDQIKNPDIIYISTIFTYYSRETLECIRHYRDNFPNSEIQVGGIFATLMPDYIEKETGIKPFVGYSKELDSYRPDYDLYKSYIEYTPKIDRWINYSVLSTTRGCPRGCGFCAVKRLEPICHIIPNWKESIDLNRRYAMILDSNITAFPFDHFKDLMEFLIKNKKTVLFNGGFDTRILTDDQIDLMSQVRYATTGLRMAFDNMGEDGYTQRAIEKLLKKGVYKTKIMVFCLFNYKDTFEEAFYRCQEVYKLGARPYPQSYHPLDQLVKKDYVSENWTQDLISKFSDYWFKASNFKSKTWEQYLEERKK